MADCLAQPQHGHATHLIAACTGLGHSSGAGLGFRRVRLRQHQEHVRCRPELFVELAILGLEATELHALERWWPQVATEKATSSQITALDGFRGDANAGDVLLRR